MNKTFLSGLLILLCLLTSAQKKNKIAIINGYAHIGNGKTIENSLIIIANNKIESIENITGIRLNHQSFDTVIDIGGMHVYPALINCNNVLGLHDAAAVRATRDWHDVGANNANLRTLIAYNTDNKIVPTIKTNGILYTQVTPRGGLISGNSSVMALEGWNWEDAVLKADDGIHINFPESNDKTDESQKEAVKNYKAAMEDLNNFFSESYAYYKTKNIAEKDLRYESMKGVFDGTKNLYIHANKAKTILSAISFVQQHHVIKPVLVGASEADLVLAAIKQNNIPVMLVRVHDLPNHPDDDIDAIYSLPAKLQKAGILFCLQTGGDSEMEAMNSRNLPFLAGSAVTYGLTKEEAISAITINTAKILGIDQLIGTLEANKLASLIVSEGDLLDMKSSQIVMAWIAGMQVNLTNQQTELYNKYKVKYGIK